MLSATVFNPIQLKTHSSILPKQLSPNFSSFKPILRLPPKPSIYPQRSLRWSIKACASDQEIDMVRTKEGVYTAKSKKVVVLWDLDNKPPRGPPYKAAMELKKLAEKFGDVVDMSAYANRHAFIHLPQWVIDERRERRRLDILERKGAVTPSEPYICSVCGRKCKTNMDLKKHFKQLHEREREKKMNRMRALKGKKRQRFKERFIDNNQKYMEAARSLVTPKEGYGLASELRRAGVFVKTVADKPQAADWALKRQMQHSMSRGIDWLFLVSDDSDFSEMLKRARIANLGTVVVGDWDRSLGRYADLWVPWIGVENGEITENDLVLKKQRSSNSRFSVSEFDGGMTEEIASFDGFMDDLVERREFIGSRGSAFSEAEDSDFEEENDEVYWLRLDGKNGKRFQDGVSINSEEEEEEDYIFDSDDEEDEETDMDE
nr:Zinc finger, C2H2 domain containing protein [Ipomoea batatas]GMD49680.1 Zinc finger, C2H2 domain containing protein [Ipomoea batatas]